MATWVPFGTGDYLIIKLKVDRWVDFTQCDDGGLIGRLHFQSHELLRKKFTQNVSPTDAQQKLSSIIDYFLVLTVGEKFTLWCCKFYKVPL